MTFTFDEHKVIASLSVLYISAITKSEFCNSNSCQQNISVHFTAYNRFVHTVQQSEWLRKPIFIYLLHGYKLQVLTAPKNLKASNVS